MSDYVEELARKCVTVEIARWDSRFIVRASRGRVETTMGVGPTVHAACCNALSFMRREEGVNPAATEGTAANPLKYHIYGFCPICGADSVSRERRPNGNDTCAGGHVYPSANATATRSRPNPLTAPQSERLAPESLTAYYSGKMNAQTEPVWWCVCVDKTIYTIGSREECERYIPLANSPMVLKLLPLRDVDREHRLLNGGVP